MKRDVIDLGLRTGTRIRRPGSIRIGVGPGGYRRRKFVIRRRRSE